MAVRNYKWLAFALLSLTLFSFRGRAPHPFHVSVMELNHNARDKTVEISYKIFTDDFENALAGKFNTKADLGKPEMHGAMDSLVKKYLASAIEVRLQGRPQDVQYLGFETDKEATYCYVEIPGVSQISQVDISNSILYDLFTDQMNIVHVFVNGRRKSDKVSYPSKDLSFRF